MPAPGHKKMKALKFHGYLWSVTENKYTGYAPGDFQRAVSALDKEPRTKIETAVLILGWWVLGKVLLRGFQTRTDLEAFRAEGKIPAKAAVFVLERGAPIYGPLRSKIASKKDG